MDDYMKPLTEAEFQIKTAFHAATRLAKTMWMVLAEPQNRVLKMLKAGNIPQFRTASYWASLCSLDVAMSQ